MNGFEVTHPWNPTDDTVLLVYNMSMDTKIFTFGLPGQCALDSVVTNTAPRPHPSTSSDMTLLLTTQHYQDRRRFFTAQ